MLTLNNILYRKFPGNNYKSVNLFHLKEVIPKQYLSMPVKFNTESVIVASLNEYFTSRVCEQHLECSPGAEPMHIAKYLSEIMRMPILTVLNTYCTLHDKKEVYEVHFYVPPSVSVQEYLPFL